MSEEEMDTSEFGAQMDTTDEEPIAEDETQVDMPDFEPSDNEDTPDMVDDDPDVSLRYAGKYSSVEELERAYESAQHKISERDDYASLGRNVAPHMDSFQQWQHSQSAPPQPESPWAPPHQWSDVQRAIGLQGTESWDSLASSERQNAEDYATYFNQKWHDWHTDPHQMMTELGTPLMSQMIDEKFAQFEAHIQAANFLREHGDELKDNLGEFQSLIESGVPSGTARELLQLRKGARSTKEVEVEKDELRKKKDRLRGRVTGRAQRSGGSSGRNHDSMVGKSFSEVFDQMSDSSGVSFDDDTVLRPTSG